MSINKNIQKLRVKHLSMSREIFAQEIDLKRTAIYLIETGQRNPSERTINDICEKFNVNKNWLLTGEGEMYKSTPQLSELINLIDNFPITKEDDFKIKTVKSLLELDNSEWEVIEKLANKISKDA